MCPRNLNTCAWPLAALLLSGLSCGGANDRPGTIGKPGVAAIAAKPAITVVEPIRLFNGKDLSGWTTFLDSSPDGPTPEQVFRVEDGLIHISGERFGGMITRDEFKDYHLSLEFRWGEQRWPPREDAPRDSGVLLHCVGPEKVWMKSIECQIQEHDCGDFWMVDGALMTVNGSVQTGRAVKKTDAEKPTGEWNTIEVICDGDRITNIVNGVNVNEGTRASLNQGRILLQSEGAEVFYRNVELRPITARREPEEARETEGEGARRSAPGPSDGDVAPRSTSDAPPPGDASRSTRHPGGSTR